MSGLNPEGWERLFGKAVYFDQTNTPIEFNRGEVESFYLPLADMIIRRSRPESRLIVGVAGPPGSGKTIFATLLVSVINAIKGSESSVYVGLDGWHYPNVYLETHPALIGGQSVSLKEIKGAPESFDSRAPLDFLRDIRQKKTVRYPLYSRDLHDPVPGKGAVEDFHQIVIFEGNYILLDETPWQLYYPFFDISIYLDAETENLLDALRIRHLRGGKIPDLVEKHMQRVDLPNIKRVKTGSKKADVTVYKSDNRHIARVEGLTSK